MTLLSRAFAVAAVVAGAGLAVLVTAPPASAHAALLGSTPKADARVTSPRDTVTLRFDEAVQATFSAVRVAGPGGQRVDSGDPSVVDNEVTQPITGFPQAGRYTVAWRVVSADGHPVSGEFGFMVAASAVSSPAPAAGSSSRRAGHAAHAGDPSFGQRHGGHLLIGLAVVVVGGGVLLWERRRRQG